MNIHDELMCPTAPEYMAAVKTIVDTFINDLKPKVPLLAIDWAEHLSSWADKG